MKIALVHDDFLQWGGAERLVKAFSEIWPEAPIFTSMYLDETSGLEWLKRKDVRPSFMQSLPLKEKLYKFYFWLYPLAFRSLSFRGYDVVLSSSARFAHMIKVPKETAHLAYINSPARMWWYPESYFSSKLVLSLLTPVLFFLRYLDKRSFGHIDAVVANSKNVAQRVRKCFGREVDAVIYPFVETRPSDYEILSLRQARGQNDAPGGFYLVVSRLVPWKKIEIVIETCNRLQLPLTIVGQGEDKSRLQKLAGPKTQILSGLTDEEVAGYYQGCSALIHPQEEDFGLTPLEAMAVGKPVLAYGKGGAKETVLPGVTGEFFEEQTVESLEVSLRQFDPMAYDPDKCRRRALEFSREGFQQKIKCFVEDNYRCHTTSKKES